MGYLISTFVGLLAAVTTAPATTQPLDELHRAREQLKALGQLPIARRMAELSREVSAVHEDSSRRTAAVYEKMEALQQTDEWKAYQAEREVLEAALRSRADAARGALAQAARDLYTARHAELRQLAVAEIPQAVELGLDGLTYPKVDGSTSTHPLSVIIAARVLEVGYEWHYRNPGVSSAYAPPLPDDLRMRGAAAMQPRSINEGPFIELQLAASRVVAIPADPQQHRLAVIINNLLAITTGTNGAYVNLVEGNADLILVARAPSADELTLAGEKGVALSAHPIARDALVFIVNRENELDNLTLQEIRALYRTAASADRNEYQKLRPKPLFRERNSGSRELFDELVMRGEALPDKPSRGAEGIFAMSMIGPYNRITSDESAIGYSVYYYERFMALSPETRTIAIEGVHPTPQTIASGEYPLTALVYAVHRSDEPADSPARRLLEWLRSDEGQLIVRESGYIPVASP